MATQLPPIPNNPITDVFVWRDWFYAVSQTLVQQTAIAWTSLNFTGSNLRDIQTRQHNALQDIQGGIPGEYYHLTTAQWTTVVSLPSVPFSVPNGGTGATSLTGYVYGNGTSAFTASTTIPYSNLTGTPTLGTMAAQNIGITATITTAKLTALGANGSMTFTNGILTAQTQAT
jgi:hypothetical protein